MVIILPATDNDSGATAETRKENLIYGYNLKSF